MHNAVISEQTRQIDLQNRKIDQQHLELTWVKTMNDE
jgi:hypothetical protein